MTRSGRRDRRLSDLSAALFALSLGISAVTIPLRAVDLGYGASLIGVMVAGSAVAQLATRSVLGVLLRLIRDKWLIGTAGMAMGASCLAFALSGSLAAFVVCQVLQGVARGVFWTSSQTHAVRTLDSPAAVAIARLNLISGIGLVAGPFASGPLADSTSSQVALYLGAAPGLLAGISAGFLAGLPVMDPGPRGQRTRVWRRPDVALANCAGMTAGGWRSLMNSYVPVLLSGGGASSSTIGLLVAGANAASIAGGTAAGRVTRERLRVCVAGCILVTGATMSLFGLLDDHRLVSVVTLLAAGLAAGILQTVGPALAAEAVAPDERGQALASSGTFRAASLLVVPLGVAGLVPLLGVGGGVVVAGLVLALPLTLVQRGRA